MAVLQDCPLLLKILQQILNAARAEQRAPPPVKKMTFLFLKAVFLMIAPLVHLSLFSLKITTQEVPITQNKEMYPGRVMLTDFYAHCGDVLESRRLFMREMEGRVPVQDGEIVPASN